MVYKAAKGVVFLTAEGTIQDEIQVEVVEREPTTPNDDVFSMQNIAGAFAVDPIFELPAELPVELASELVVEAPVEAPFELPAQEIVELPVQVMNMGMFGLGNALANMAPKVVESAARIAPTFPSFPRLPFGF